MFEMKSKSNLKNKTTQVYCICISFDCIHNYKFTKINFLNLKKMVQKLQGDICFVGLFFQINIL